MVYYYKDILYITLTIDGWFLGESGMRKTHF